jgi:ABC-type uncharacterized transport system permease subunit
MDWSPWARIVARYVIGALAAKFGGDVLTGPELENVLALTITALAGAATEAVYAYAKRKGWAT